MNGKVTGAAAMFFWALSALFIVGSLVAAWNQDVFLVLACFIVSVGTLFLGVVTWKE